MSDLIPRSDSLLLIARRTWRTATESYPRGDDRHIMARACGTPARERNQCHQTALALTAPCDPVAIFINFRADYLNRLHAIRYCTGCGCERSLYIFPFFITKLTFWSREISARGFPFTATISATLPTPITPRSSTPNSSAAFTVAVFIACAGLIPYSTRSTKPSAF